MDHFRTISNILKTGGKVLVILRGPSGSGKSYFAEKLKEKYEDAMVHTTDDYFMVDGEYKFDFSKIGYYHTLNREAAENDMSVGVEIVVVANTNTTFKEMRPYIEAAKDYGYEILIVEPSTDWAWDIDELVKRNAHSVPKEAIERMVKRYESLTSIKQKIKELKNE